MDRLSRSRTGLALRPLTAISFLELCRNVEGEENAGSRFRKLSHSIWRCQHHIIWVPKYRYRVLVGPIQEAAYTGIQAICGYVGCEVVELNVQDDPDLRKIPGERGTAGRAAYNRQIRKRPNAAQPRPATFGGWPCPPCGG